MNYLQLDKYTVLKYSPLKSIVTLKSWLGVIHSHWKQHHSIDRIVTKDISCTVSRVIYLTTLCDASGSMARFI